MFKDNNSYKEPIYTSRSDLFVDYVFVSTVA